MNNIKFFLNFILLIIKIKNIFNFTEEQKNKVKACLVIYKSRMFEDKINYDNFIKENSKKIKDFKDKVFLFGLTNCYLNINDEYAYKIIYVLNKKTFDPLSKQNFDLLNIENFSEKQVSDKNFQKIINEFTDIFKELKDEGEFGNSNNNNNNNSKYLNIDEKKMNIINKIVKYIFILYAIINIIIMIYIRIYKVKDIPRGIQNNNKKKEN
jgi:hypothetical protein